MPADGVMSNPLIRLFTRLLECVTVAAMALLTLDVLWGIVVRFFGNFAFYRWCAEKLASVSHEAVVSFMSRLNRSTDEMATSLLVWTVMLAAPIVYAERAHLGVNVLVARLSPGLQRLTDALVHLLVIFFAGVVMIYGGWRLVEARFDAGQVLPGMGWPKAYVYLAVPVSGVLFVFYAVLMMCFDITKRHDPLPAETVEQLREGGAG